MVRCFDQNFKTHNMQTLKMMITGLAMSATLTALGQAKGNYDFRAASNYTYTPTVQIAQAATIAVLEQAGHNTFSIKGLFNCKADSYLAIFAMTQVGKTQAEADSIMRYKINSIKDKLANKGGDAELFIDMISFIPVYEIEVTRKLFSKDTYSEIPIGFELKKNLHFKYSDPAILDYLVTICAEAEIYDLVRVDYFIDDLEGKKAEMTKKAEAILKKDVGRFKRLMNVDFTDRNVLLADNFAMTYPIERYKVYEAYCSNSVMQQQSATAKQPAKSKSQFYMPKMAKGYDFVIHPSVHEPVVQMEYEIIMKYYPKPVVQEKPKEIIKTEIKKDVWMVTPDGQLKKLNL